MWKVKADQHWFYGESLKDLRLQLDRHLYPMGEIDWILERARECSAPILLLLQREADRWQLQFEGFETYTGELKREGPTAFRIRKYGAGEEVITGEEVGEYLHQLWPEAAGYEMVALNGVRRAVKGRGGSSDTAGHQVETNC